MVAYRKIWTDGCTDSTDSIDSTEEKATGDRRGSANKDTNGGRGNKDTDGGRGSSLRGSANKDRWREGQFFEGRCKQRQM